MKDAGKMQPLFSDSAVPRVVVATSGSASCFECQKLEGAIYGIDRALESMPIPYACCRHGQIRIRTVDGSGAIIRGTGPKLAVMFL